MCHRVMGAFLLLPGTCIPWGVLGSLAFCISTWCLPCLMPLGGSCVEGRAHGLPSALIAGPQLPHWKWNQQPLSCLLADNDVGICCLDGCDQGLSGSLQTYFYPLHCIFYSRGSEIISFLFTFSPRVQSQIKTKMCCAMGGYQYLQC